MNYILLKELMKQSETECGFDSDKFAQLIVQECISTLEEKIYQSIDNDGDEVWADLILKEHFGVEE